MSIDTISRILVGVEFLVALLIVGLDVKEVRFLRRLQPLLPKDEDLPLYNALTDRAIFLMVVGVYLIGLTILGVLGFAIAAAFPPIRPINGLIFLGILAGPVYLGRAMRRAPKIKRVIDQ